MRSSKSIYFPLILLLTATLVQCRYDHWYQQFHKDSTTSTASPQAYSADSKTDANDGGLSLQNANSFDDDFYRDRVEDSARLAVGVIIAIVIACIVIFCCILYCCIRICNAMCCSTEQRGHVVIMNHPMGQTQPERPVPQVIVQQVPVPYQPYPAQQHPVYAGQMNEQMQHVPPEAVQHQQEYEYLQKSQGMTRFPSNQEIYQQPSYSPHDPNQPPVMAPPPYQKF